MAIEDQTFSRTNPFWEQFKEFRARLRENVVSYGCKRSDTEELLHEADVAIRKAMADEFDAYAWGDGEDYHMEEYEAMVQISGRITHNIELYKMRRIHREGVDTT